jgi:hypothetical protein
VTEPRSVPPTSDELKQRRSESERRSIGEWMQVCRDLINKAKERK